MVLDVTDRIIAVLIYKGKVYEDECNHQYALQTALEEYGDSIENYVEDERYEDCTSSFIEGNIDAIVEYTWARTVDNEIFTFSNFDNEYLIAHTKDCIELNKDLIIKYAKTNNLKLAYFINMHDNKNEFLIYK